MRKATLGAVMIVLGLSVPVVAQPSAALPAPQLLPPPADAAEPAPITLPPPTPLPSAPAAPVPVPEITEPLLGFSEITGEPLPGRFWSSAEFLIWRTEAAPLNYPLETAAQAQYNSTGAVKSSQFTYTYFGRSNLSYQNYSGANVTTGYWFNPEETFGIEAKVFFIDSPGVTFNSPASNTSPSIVGPGIPGVPVTIFRPYILASSNTPSGLLIAKQTASTGFVSVNSGSSLIGAEANLIRTVCNGPALRVDLLAGYRYLNLTESLDVLSGSNAMGSSSTAPVSAPYFVVYDHFQTINQFNGGQFGSRFAWTKDHLAITVTTKVAVGDNAETLDVGGLTTAASRSGIAVTPGGFLALPSNSGRFTHDDVSVVPQVGLTLGYLIGSHCRIYVGYDYLFWSQVARPGAEINPVINPTQVPSSPYYVPGAAPTYPQAIFLQRNFWAQGVNFGLEVRY